jgi:4-aminobutyrate aminotransferase/(S)-3-amino-2-methylpropionate transaminase
MSREKSRHWAERLAQVESPGVTTLADNWPIFWESAQGAHVVDVDGQRYVDMGAGFGVMSVGYSNPVVVQAIAEQSDRLIHGMGDVHPPRIKVELLEALAEIAPGTLGLSVLSMNGSDAIETALKCALLVTGRPEVIAFDGAYHGLGGSALNVTARADFRDPFGPHLSAFASFEPFPESPAAADEVLLNLRRRLETQDVGAIIIEPIQGRGGVRVPSHGFLPALRKLCTEFDALLVFDEVFTGLGRTGDWFAANHEAVVPDLLCVGKALGGGMPLSACIGGPASLARWPAATGEAIHTSTFLGHPVCCAAALAAVREIRRLELPQRARLMGQIVMDRLSGADVVDVRGRGLMIGVELESGARAGRVVEDALREGVILLPCGAGGQVLSLTPPLIIDEDSLNQALDVILRCIRNTAH